MTNIRKFASVFITILLVSCNKQDKKIDENIDITSSITKYLNSTNWRYPTETDLELLKTKGYISSLDYRTLTCAWADGFGGSLNCDGGSCHVYLFPAEGTPTTANLICVGADGYINGTISRPI